MVIYMKLSLITKVKDSHGAELHFWEKESLKTEAPLTEEKKKTIAPKP